MSARRLRILCLHGFRQNAKKIDGRTRSLQKALKSVAEFVFVDAPIQVPVLDDDTVEGRQAGAQFTWWNTRDDPNTGECVYAGWEDTREYLRDFCESQGPFDGVLGFSQGAIVASILAMESSSGPVGSPPLSFRFAILVSGFPPRADSLQPLFSRAAEAAAAIASSSSVQMGSAANTSSDVTAPTPTIDELRGQAREMSTRGGDDVASTSSSGVLGGGGGGEDDNVVPEGRFKYPPTLHVIGSGDTVVPPSASMLLASFFESPKFLLHEGGHYVPVSKNFKDTYLEFLQEQLDLLEWEETPCCA